MIRRRPIGPLRADSCHPGERLDGRSPAECCLRRRVKMKAGSANPSRNRPIVRLSSSALSGFVPGLIMEHLFATRRHAVHFDNAQIEWSAWLARGAAIPMGVQFPIATRLFGRGSEFWELLRKMNDPRQYAPATLRNRDFIVGVLRDVLPTKGVILEIASGSGEHVVHFARNFPSLVFQPSDREPDALQSIAAWVKASRVTNARAPMVLEVSQSPWPIASADGIICINMVHISPWETTLGLVRGAAAILPPTAPLYLYGPYKREGFATASSNQAFDRSLRDRDPTWGLRDLEAVAAAAQSVGFSIPTIIEMPANNLSVVFRRI